MFTPSNSKKAKRKLEIKELAEVATDEINKNKFLSQTLDIYQQQINIIKKILEIKSKLNNNNKTDLSINTTNISITNQNNNIKPNIKETIKNEFLSYYNQLKNSVINLKEINKKFSQKFETNYNKFFDESSMTKINLYKNRTDIFILDYELKKKNDIIRKLNENLLNSRRHSIFREMKRDSEVNRNSGTNYLNTDNLYLQRDLQIECKHYNKCINRCKKKVKTIKKIKETEKFLEEVIQYLEKETNPVNKKKNKNKNSNKIFGNKNNQKKNDTLNKRPFPTQRQNNKENDNNFNSITLDELGKKYNFEEDYSLNLNYNNDITFMPNNNDFNSLFFSSENLKLPQRQKQESKEKKKKVKQKLNFLTVDELFDLDNVEGEKEFIIQEELHSDEEIIFEKKIKNKNRINTEYLTQIKKQVPGLYLNQIEFNKKKVMNEADLYSLQRREFNRQNIDENIKTMKKKIKIMKRRISINQEKLKAMTDFVKKAEEQYEVLKPIKVLSSMKDYDISFMKKEFYNQRKNKNNNNEIIPEVDEKNDKIEGDEDSYDPNDKYNLDDEDDVDDYSDKMRKKNKKYNNNDTMTMADYEYDKNQKGKKLFEYNDDENRAKSK